jgi:hypothetical protein
MASRRERGLRRSCRCRYRATRKYCPLTRVQKYRPNDLYRHLPGVCSTLRESMSAVWALSDGRVFVRESAVDENKLSLQAVSQCRERERRVRF